MRSIDQSPLGRAVAIPDRVDARVLYAVPRAAARVEIGIDGDALPFIGVDIWNAYELSWLDARDKPHVAIAELRVPAISPNLVESKSLKLYLNGYANERHADAQEVRERITRDLSDVAGATAEAMLTEASGFDAQRIAELPGASLDELELDFDGYGPPQPAHLRANTRAREVEEALTTQLFRSNCPVTGQPDWASVQVRYRGAPIDHAGLLRYLISYRQHADFHEACVERIFVDIMSRCATRSLAVYARFSRRGGIDINPWRATPGFAAPLSNLRGARQ